MIKVGKSGRNAHISVLANALAATAEPFTNSSETFFGSRENWGWYGQLPAEWTRIYLNTDVAYTVFSYKTPIAWQDGNGQWTVPAVTYSKTTSQHQSKVRAAMEFNGRKYIETPSVTVTAL